MRCKHGRSYSVCAECYAPPTDDVGALTKAMAARLENLFPDEGQQDWLAVAKFVLTPDALAAHDAQVRRDATREALADALDDLADDQQKGDRLAVDDPAMWLAHRIDTASEPAARAVPTKGEACACLASLGPVECICAPTPPTVGDDEVETVTEWRVESETLEDEFGTDETAARRWLDHSRELGWPPSVLMKRTMTTSTTAWEEVR